MCRLPGTGNRRDVPAASRDSIACLNQKWSHEYELLANMYGSANKTHFTLFISHPFQDWNQKTGWRGKRFPHTHSSPEATDWTETRRRRDNGPPGNRTRFTQRSNIPVCPSSGVPTAATFRLEGVQGVNATCRTFGILQIAPKQQQNDLLTIMSFI